LKIPPLAEQDVIFLSEEYYGKKSPLDLIGKLECLVRACRHNVDTIIFTLLTMMDHVLNGLQKSVELNLTMLAGKRAEPKGLLSKTFSL